MHLFFSQFSRKSKVFFGVIVLVGVLNSGLNSAFMVIVSRTITNTSFLTQKSYYPYLFLVFFLTCIALNVIFFNYIIKISTSITCEVELNLMKKIRDSSFRNISAVKKEEVYSAIRYLSILGDAPNRFLSIFNAFLTVVGCLIYLFWISALYGVVLIILIGTLILTFLLKIKMRKKIHDDVRALDIQYYKHLEDLLSGFKDIKMSDAKGENIFSNSITKNRYQSRLLDIQLKNNTSNSNMVANYSWYIVLAIVLFVFPKIEFIQSSTIPTFILIIVYVINPVSSITSFFPFYTGLKSASTALDLIYKKLGPAEKAIKDRDKPLELAKFSSMVFTNLRFHYFEEDQSDEFVLGPINLTIEKNQILFITGGNGSGKSTFLTLLAGLQQPTSGTIHYNQIEIGDPNYAAFRNQISAVFIEAYLMNYNYEAFELNDANKKFSDYLELMKLPARLKINSLFDQKHKLSKGQQKRLALILALLMDRDILVLDEWAAEQDPSFRDYFYRHVLPFLRDQGKTIIAITHDEQYFSCADRLIKFDSGQVIEDYLNAPDLHEPVNNARN